MPQKTLPPIKAVRKEVHAFYNVVLSLNSVLKDEDVRNLDRDSGRLDQANQQCEVILRQLIVKLERLCNTAER